MVLPQQPPAVAELPKALSHVVERVLAEHYGKGPARTRTWLRGPYVLTVCEEVLTQAERALLDAGRPDVVNEVHLGFQDVVTRVFAGEVEHLTGRTLVGYHSLLMPECDRALEVFVLDPSRFGYDVPDEPVAHARDTPLAEPGEEGDADALPVAPGRSMTQAAAPESDFDGAARTRLIQELTRIVHGLHGRGPAHVRVHLLDDHVVCLLEEPLTTGERTLAAGGRADLVRRARDLLAGHAGPELSAAVERAAGRQVIGFRSQVVLDPDVVVLWFALTGA
jgi:uncharacterized protein YbcI